MYKLSSQFPDTERFGLTNQIRRAAVSIASNIAEGYGKSSKGEYLLFLGHARGRARKSRLSSSSQESLDLAR